MKITRATAKYVLWEMYRTGKEAAEIIKEQNLEELTRDEVLPIIDQVLRDNPKAVAQYRRFLDIKRAF